MMELPVSEKEHLMHRVADPDTSAQSAKARARLNLFKVLDVIRSFGDAGCIADEVFEMLNFGHEDETGPMSYSGITGTWVILERQRFIERTGEERIGNRFGASQLVMRALSDNERALRLMQDMDVVSKSLTEDDYAKINEWYAASEALKLAKQREAEARGNVVQFVFGDPPNGQYAMPLMGGYELTAKVASSKTYLSWRIKK